MKLNIRSVDWNNVSAVNKTMQPWLKASPSRNELARVAPMLFKNAVLAECAKKADLKTASEGMCRLIQTRSYDVAIKTITDLLAIMNKLAPLHEEFKGTNVPKPALYSTLQDSVDDALSVMSDVTSDKYELPDFSFSYDPLTNKYICSILSVTCEADVQDALAAFFENTGQGYVDLLKSIKEKKAMEYALQVAQVNVNAGCQGKSRALAHAL